MNASQCKQLMPVLQAWIDGETIQFQDQGKWTDLEPQGHLDFCEVPAFYRIKPEPRSIFFAEDFQGAPVRSWMTRQEAEEWLEERRTSLRTSDYTIVEFKEIV